MADLCVISKLVFLSICGGYFSISESMKSCFSWKKEEWGEFYFRSVRTEIFILFIFLYTEWYGTGEAAFLPLAPHSQCVKVPHPQQLADVFSEFSYFMSSRAEYISRASLLEVLELNKKYCWLHMSNLRLVSMFIYVIFIQRLVVESITLLRGTGAIWHPA